jgi:D-hydroxyproline dehydrogenase
MRNGKNLTRGTRSGRQAWRRVLKTAVIIGGGFIGAACAWQLQRAGFSTTIVDGGAAERAASWGNAGHLAIEQVDPLASMANVRSLPRRLFAFGGPVGLPLRDVSAWLPFGLKLIAASAPERFAKGQRALSGLLAHAMPAWQRLAAQTHTAQHLRADGHYVAWESAASAERGKRHWLSANIGEARARPATADELQQLRAQFNQRPVDAVRFEGSGQILDLASARSGIVTALRNEGGATQSTNAVGIVLSNAKASVKLSDGTSLTPDVLLVAAGVSSAPLLRASEGVVPLIAERGYHVEATIGESADRLPPVAFEDRSVIVTRFASTLRIAGFTEFSRVDSPPDERKWQALTGHAAALGLPFASNTSRWIGARPTLPDYLPAIGRSRAAENLLYAFGHQHLGLTLAAITGELVAALASGAASAIDLSPFDLKRFQ